MSAITYIKGDATCPQAKGNVIALSDRWDEPEAQFRSWYMIGQKGIKRGSSGPPIRYDAVAACLEKVAEQAIELGASVHMPRIGCGLAGENGVRLSR